MWGRAWIGSSSLSSVHGTPWMEKSWSQRGQFMVDWEVLVVDVAVHSSDV
jgi:hypothetical protein